MASKPLQEPAFLVSSALAAGPSHGYGIAQDVESSSDGRVTSRAGTLYGAIDRLVAAGLVEVDHEEVVDSRSRRYYRLTSEGGSRLAAEAERAEARARRALERLGSTGDDHDGYRDTDAAGPVLVAPVLVRDYRRSSRLFPYTYRRAHEAEMLGHSVDGARPGQSRPTRAERWDSSRAAAREWSLAPSGSSPRQRRAATGLSLVVSPAVLVVMASRVLAFAAAIVGAVLGPSGHAPLSTTVPTASMWTLWLAAVALTLAGAQRVGLAAAVLAAVAGVGGLAVSLGAGSSYAAYLDAPWVAAVSVYAGVLAARRACRVGPEPWTLRAATLGAMALALGGFAAATAADAASFGAPWWSGVASSPWTPPASAAPVVSLLGVASSWRRTRPAVPVLGGLALAGVSSRSAYFWSGTVNVQTADLGNVLGSLALAAAATLVSTWVVNRLDELAEVRAAHRARLAAAGGVRSRGGSRPGAPTAV
ncbi:hypothetical protein OY671_004858 [Metschnikowia pulcherrima]|nr:hypothetical protein OY671_004858 [Metschnikowia pulcherrima]